MNYSILQVRIGLNKYLFYNIRTMNSNQIKNDKIITTDEAKKQKRRDADKRRRDLSREKRQKSLDEAMLQIEADAERKKLNHTWGYSNNSLWVAQQTSMCF